MTVGIVLVLLSVIPSFRLSAQGVLNQFSYDELRLSGIQLDVGVLGASELTGATVGGLRIDYGRIAPRVRLLLGLSYFRSQFDQNAQRRFEQRLDSTPRPSSVNRHAGERLNSNPIVPFKPAVITSSASSTNVPLIAGPLPLRACMLTPTPI